METYEVTPERVQAFQAPVEMTVHDNLRGDMVAAKGEWIVYTLGSAGTPAGIKEITPNTAFQKKYRKPLLPCQLTHVQSIGGYAQPAMPTAWGQWGNGNVGPSRW